MVYTAYNAQKFVWKFSADLTCILVINTSVIGLFHKHVCEYIVSNQEPFLSISTVEPGTLS